MFAVDAAEGSKGAEGAEGAEGADTTDIPTPTMLLMPMMLPIPSHH